MRILRTKRVTIASGENIEGLETIAQFVPRYSNFSLIYQKHSVLIAYIFSSIPTPV